MEKIYSRVEPEKLLHFIVRKSDIKPGRVNLVADDQFLQCASLNLDKGTTFKPHKHKWQAQYGSNNRIAQESWVVIEGRVKCIFYDLDDQMISTHILNVGDASFTLEGGHNYEIMEDNSIIYEMKVGPYLGQEMDKSFIK